MTADVGRGKAGGATPHPGDSDGPDKGEREARLAQALRNNLRRRKAVRSTEE